MDFRTALDSIRQAFVIGRGNRFLHGEQADTDPAMAYDAQLQSPYRDLQPSAGNPHMATAQGYATASPTPPPDAYGPYGYYADQVRADPSHGQPMPDAARPQTSHQDPYAAPAQGAYNPPESFPQYQTQINAESQPRRNRRSQQHSAQGPAQPMPSPENVVPFPGSQQAVMEPARQLDAYVVNVSSIQACRQAMSCLREGQCTLVVIDQVADKAEMRRYVDMLTGACYALGGTMTRLSAKIGFYVMAPQGMTVYTDPVTTAANTPPRPQPVSPDRAAAYPFDRYAPTGAAAPRQDFRPQQPPAYGEPTMETRQPPPGYEEAAYGREYYAAR